MTARHHILTHAAAFVAMVVVMLVGATSASAAASDSVGFGVAPVRFDLDTRPGGSSTHQITITNTDAKAVTFSFSKEDIQGDKDDPAATPVLLGGEFESAISGYDWLSVPDNVTVAGGASKTVSVRVAVPSGASGGHYAAMVVQGATRAGGDLQFQSRMAVLFLMNAGGAPPPDIVVTEIVEQTGGGTRVVYDNEGTTHTTPDPFIETDPTGPGPTTKGPVGECTTALPGGSGECIIPDSEGGGSVGLLGRDEREVVLDGGEGTSARAELPAEWAGTWSSLLLPLVGIALFVLYFLFLRRRRKDNEDLDDGEDPWAAVPLA